MKAKVAAPRAASPLSFLGVSVAQGAAWCGQLWAPERRGRQGTSPLSAAAGYAVLTLAFGVLVDQTGARGVVLMHASFGVAAAVAWLVADAARLWSRRAKARGDRLATATGRLDDI